MIYLPSILVVITLIVEVWRDVKQFKRIGEIDHQIGFTIRFIGVLVAWGVEAFLYPSGSFYVPLYAVGLYLIFFDSLIAKFLGKSWFYVGHTSWWDKIQRRFVYAIAIMVFGYQAQKGNTVIVKNESINKSFTIWYILKALTGAGLIYFYFTLI